MLLGGEGANKTKVQMCWKWTYTISVGRGLTNNSPKWLEMDLYYFGGDRVN